MEKAIFGGGCFWCTEAVFKMLKGVKRVVPGYSGGSKEDATYDKVSSGKTGHAECTLVEYDPAEVAYKDLLTVFFGSHDPTTVNRQGNDTGPQYRSIIFWTTPAQRTEALAFIDRLNASNPNGNPIVTEVEPLDEFYEAEDYHKDYYANNQSAPYCQIIINPKLEKVQKEFENLLKKHESNETN